MRLLDFINENTNNAYKDFKLVSVIFDEKLLECTFKFLYKDTISDNAREELSKVIKDFLQEDVGVVVKCKKAYIDVDLVRDVVYNFIIRNFGSIGVEFLKSNVNVSINDEINVEILCNPFQYAYIKGNNIDLEIIEYANSFFFEGFNLDVKSVESFETTEEIVPTIDIDFGAETKSDIKYTKVDNIRAFVGTVSGNALQIESIKEALEDIEIAGTIRYLTERTFDKTDKNNKTVTKKYYNFSISDKSGKMNCVYFPNKNDLPKIEELKDGDTVVLHGSIDDYGGRYSFKVKGIAFCDIVSEQDEPLPEVESKKVNDKYYFVQPEPYVEMFQDNLFTKAIDVGEYLRKNDVVVFDIETTGLEATRCEIIEIGAVKIHEGKIIETFETLIKPTTPIPDEITDITGITDEMVSMSPTIAQVLPDFYKFCYNCTIMAYNIDFDYKFVSIQGRKLGYIFDNKQIDVLYLARAFVPGLKNFKLGTVCKKLGVSLENAHRAVHDAMATAEVVVKLGPNIPLNS